MARAHEIVSTPIADLTVVAEDDSLVGIYFPGHWHPPGGDELGARLTSKEAGERPPRSLLADVERQLGEYFDGRRTRFELPTAFAGGSETQRAIWERLVGIPFGETVSYGEIAAELGLGGRVDSDPSGAREVGAAVGRNPISIVVPCHRVVGKDGSLTGYAGGLERKRFLLDLEAPTMRLDVGGEGGQSARERSGSGGRVP